MAIERDRDSRARDGGGEEFRETGVHPGEWLPFIRFSSRAFERKNKTKDAWAWSTDSQTDRQARTGQNRSRKGDESRQGEASPSLKINNIKAGPNCEAAAKAQSKQRKRKKEEKRNESCVVEKSRGKRLKTNERCRASTGIDSRTSGQSSREQLSTLETGNQRCGLQSACDLA